MSRLRSLSLGAKINVALLVFLLVLGGAASLVVLFGFDRTKTNASTRSNEALQEQGKLTLLAVVGGLSDIGAIESARSGQIGQSVAQFLDDFNAQNGRMPVDVSTYATTANGIWYDPSPSRVSDVVVPGNRGITAEAQDDIAYSAPLDALFRALAESLQDQISQGFRPTAIVFVGANRIARYYPPIGIQNTTPPDADPTSLFEQVGPAANPQRSTIWTAPYEDVQGRGLVMTAHTPVYEGDTFRGAVEVDISIANLAGLLDGIHPTESGFAFYLARDGSVLGTTGKQLLGSASAPGSDAAAILDTMRRQGTDGGSIEAHVVTLAGREYLLAYAPVRGFGGSVAAVAPLDEVTAGSSPIASGIDDDANRTLAIMFGAIGALFLAALVAATYFNRRAIVRPLAALAGATARVSGGDLNVAVPVDRRDEFGALAADFNVMVEQLRESERALEQRVADRTREIAGLLEVTRVVSSTLQVQPLLELVLDQTLGVLPYDRAVIMLREGEDLHMLAVRAGAGEPDDTLTAQVGMRLPLAEVATVWGVCARGEPVMIGDVQEGDGLAAAYRQEVGRYIGPAVGRFRTWMGIPLMVKGEPAGLMALARTMAGGYAPEHAALGKAIASQVAIAIENARLFEQARQTASLEERQRLARELHDSVSQALYGIALGTRTARLRLGDDPHDAAEPMDYVASLAQAGLAEMRALIFELRPESLEQEGVVAAIEKQAASVAARYKLDVALDLGEEPACALDIKEALYRIAQEALHNVVKHAQAAHVEIRLRAAAGGLELVIRDDGLGFDAAQAFPGHVGLQSMPERARKLGGAVVIESAPGAGTTVTATVPAA